MKNRNRNFTLTAITAFLMAVAILAALPGYAPVQAFATESGMTVNINSATSDELMTLPGIGQAKAAAILSHRSEHGAFGAPEDLLQVKGIGETLLQKIRPYVTTGGSKKAR